MIDPQLVSFIGIITILTVTPSATTMLITRSTIASGQSANRSRIRQRLEILSGVALIFFGFKVATAKR